jgi:hypothetical protein
MKTKILLLLTFSVIGLYYILYYVIMPREIEHRLRDLGLMQYNGSKDKMVAKDSVTLNNYDVYYIQYGNLKGY